MTRFDDASAVRALEALEARLRGAPFQILGIQPDASVADACVAFAALAATYHPRQFSEVKPIVAHRAHLLYQQLRLALQQHLTSLERGAAFEHRPTDPFERPRL